MGGFLLYKELKESYYTMFPSPLEVWVVSYKTESVLKAVGAVFPSPLEAWGVSYKIGSMATRSRKRRVSVPSRGMGGFLQDGKR